VKFKLICDYENGDGLITHEFEKVLLSDVLTHMQDFLKGCGFVFDGTLDIVEEDAPDVYAYETFEKPTQEELKDTDLDGRC